MQSLRLHTCTCLVNSFLYFWLRKSVTGMLNKSCSKMHTKRHCRRDTIKKGAEKKASNGKYLENAVNDLHKLNDIVGTVEEEAGCNTIE